MQRRFEFSHQFVFCAVAVVAAAAAQDATSLRVASFLQLALLPLQPRQTVKQIITEERCKRL
jgi:predicted CoA-binding protein